jgi:O-antigen ligase
MGDNPDSVLTAAVRPALAATARHPMLERNLFAGLVAALALVPLVMTSSFLHYDITPKVVLTIVAGALGCCWFACSAWTNTVRPATDDRLLLLAIGAHALILILCTITSAAPHLSFGGGVWRRFGLISRVAALIAVCALASLGRGRHERWLWIVRSFCICGTVTAVYAICQYFGVDPWIDSRTYRDAYWSTLRPPSTMGHAAYFATFCVQVLFWALALGSSPRPRGDRILGVVTAVLCSFALILTGTRAGLAGAGVGFLCLLVSGRRFLSVRVWIIPVGVAVFALAILYLSPSGSFLRKRLNQWVTDASGGPRLLLWRDSLSMARTRVVTGFGLETFTQYFPSFESTQMAVAYPEFAHESPHNIMLDTLLEQGLPGVLALLGLAAVCVRLGWRAVASEHRQQATFILASLAAAVAAQQFTAFTLPTYVMFLVNLALLAMLPLRRKEDAPHGARSYSSRWAWAAIGAVLIGFAAKYSTRETELSHVGSLLRRGMISSAIDEYRSVDRSGVLGETPDLWYSRRVITAIHPSTEKALQTRALQEAIEAATRASSSSEERFNAYFELAVLWALTDNGPKTEESLRGAIAWAPEWYEPHWYLSRILAASGRNEESMKESALAKALSGGRPLK